MYSIVIVVYLKVGRRVDLKYSHYQKMEWQLGDVMQVLAKAVVVIILQYRSLSNQYIVHLKLTQCYICQLCLSKAGKICRILVILVVTLTY